MELSLLLIVILASIGIANTLYLSWHAITKTDVKCVFFPPEWCQKVQHSPQSRTLGIPNPFLGLGMYVGLLVLTILFDQNVVPFWPIAAIIVAGFLFSAYFTYIQGKILKAWCTWCVLSAVDFSLLLLVLVFRVFA